MSTDKPIMMVGSGPSGLMQALFLASVRKRKVIIVERQPGIGGLYGSVKSPWGPLDQGVHLVEQIGHPVWDALVAGALPQDAWHVYGGVQKDIAGNIFAGRVDTGSLYPDLRRLPRADHDRCVAEIFAAAKSPSVEMTDASHLGNYFESRFGPHATQTVLASIVRKIWKQPLDRLSPWAAKIVHLSRVVTHDAETALELKKTKSLDAVIGFPEQLNFPPGRLAGSRKALYPRQYGLEQVVDGLHAALLRHGVEFLVSTKVERLEIDAGSVAAVHVSDAENKARRIEVADVIWTAPQFELARLLGLPISVLPDEALPHRVAFLFLKQPPGTGKTYWMWSYDQGDWMVRLSNPAAYCPAAARPGLHPICVETHVDDPATPDEAVLKQVEADLRKYGIIHDGESAVGGVVLPSLRGFFVPTVANCDAIGLQRRAIESIGISNLMLSTQDVAKGVFYMRDIVAASLPKLEAL
jgi:protoporphyrinogen oxidase